MKEYCKRMLIEGAKTGDLDSFKEMVRVFKKSVLERGYSSTQALEFYNEAMDDIRRNGGILVNEFEYDLTNSGLKKILGGV